MFAFEMRDLAKTLEKAERGNAKAQCNLGWAYDTGDGVRKSLRLAAHWYERAAKQGHAVAQYNLSLCYLLGQGVKKNALKSFKWNRRAAKAGHTDAQLAMGWFYHGGRAVKQNLKKAKIWYWTAAKNNSKSAMFSLGQMAYDKRKFREAARWFLKASKIGHPRSEYYLGNMFLHGKGVSADPFRAKACLEMAANAGIGYAKRLLNGQQLKQFLVQENAVTVNRWRQGALLPAIHRH